jgi:hypothetical protein
MIFCSFLISVFLLLVIGNVQTSYGQSVQSSPSLFPHDSKPYNVTMAKWLERYWNWLASIPEDVHPRGDTTGKNCGTDQAGPVWYLDLPVERPMKQTRYCEIPEDKAIFVPVFVSECDQTVTSVHNYDELGNCAKEENKNANMKFHIDGKPLLEINPTSEEHYSLYRTLSDLFNMTWIENNVVRAEPGPVEAVSDGYFVIVQPLPLGDHQMYIQSNRLGTGPDMGENEIKYNIKIVKNESSSS